MVANCIVKGCKSRQIFGGTISFYRLPWKNELLCRQWIIRAGFDEKHIGEMFRYKNSRMCSLHFTRKDNNSIPDLNIPDFERQLAATALLAIWEGVPAYTQSGNVSKDLQIEGVRRINDGASSSTCGIGKEFHATETVKNQCNDKQLPSTVIDSVEEVVPVEVSEPLSLQPTLTQLSSSQSFSNKPDQQIQSVDNMEEDFPVDVSEPLSSQPSSTHLSTSQFFFNKPDKQLPSTVIDSVEEVVPVEVSEPLSLQPTLTQLSSSQSFSNKPDQQIQSVDNMEEDFPVDVSEPLSSQPSSTHLSTSQFFFNKPGKQIPDVENTEDGPVTPVYVNKIFTSQSTSTQQTETPENTRKRKFFDCSSQVTPKAKSRRTKGVQKTPPVQKSTQMTPKHKRSSKCNTEFQTFTTSSQQTSSSYININPTATRSTQTVKNTSNKSVQVTVSKLELLKCSDKELKKYTGIEDYNLFKILHKYLASCCTDNSCNIKDHDVDPNKIFKHISSENQLLLVLYKLKRNSVDSVLASEFNISTGRISEIFKYWILRMYRKFKIIKTWPSKEKIDIHMPLTTRQHFPDLVALSDCVEFSTQVPRGPLPGKQLFSHYKNCHTVKAMFTTAPNGALIHCSDLYGGNVSDKEIFAQSDLPNRLQAGDGLMVDKGFLIKDVIQGKGIKLYRPPFLSEKNKQFQCEERDLGRTIARSRITVENFNARLSNYAFMKQKKISILHLPIINEIGFVVGFLANLGPLIRNIPAHAIEEQDISENEIS